MGVMQTWGILWSIIYAINWGNSCDSKPENLSFSSLSAVR